MNPYFPEKSEFIKQAKKGNMTPVYKEILADMETPVSAFKKIGGGKYSFLLESVEGGERIARYSFLGNDTNLVIKSKGKDVSILRNDVEEKIKLKEGQDPLHILKEEMNRFNYIPNSNLPKFCGGAVGFMSFDMVRFFENLPSSARDDLNLPDCTFIFTDTLLIFDHVRHRIKVVSNVRIGDNPSDDYDKATKKIDDFIQKLKAPIEPSPKSSKSNTLNVTSNFTKEEYENVVKKCKEYITEGDIIQVVPSQRFTTKFTSDPFDVYRALRSINPSPYMYYLAYDDIKLVGSSPEILVTAEQGNVTTRPIAGTRPRGKNEDDDNSLEDELIKDEKERAEHIMLVDLGRNDIGRVCRYGSVNVDQLMQIEKYSHVMHIVSNVRGKLRMDKDQFDLLRACFPAGTVSGAPKIRAMEIIDEVEPTRRGSYAGAIGYFSYSGDMDTCITIRTILMQGDTAYVQAGGGVVADSNPATEYQETQNKAMALIKALSVAEAGLE